MAAAAMACGRVGVAMPPGKSLGVCFDVCGVWMWWWLRRWAGDGPSSSRRSSVAIMSAQPPPVSRPAFSLAFGLASSLLPL
jgi:hypothetical protein